jgi:hypothetical protein
MLTSQGMQLHWGKEYLFSVVPDHIQSRLKEAVVDPHYDADEPFPHVNGETGEVIAEVHMAGIVRVSRRKLRRLLGWKAGLNVVVFSLSCLWFVQLELFLILWLTSSVYSLRRN